MGSTTTVYFEVRDTGIGIEPSHHGRLFESFSQADASTTRRYGGTGLGLAICRRLTEAMDGEIGLDSVPEEGSTFWFRIPLPVAPPSTDPVPAPGFLAGLKVLVVDDNATNRLVLESQLRGWKLRPEAVPDAKSALVLAREATAAGEPFDLAVLDLCMPDTDGLELARAIKADAGLSGHGADHAHLHHAGQCGGDRRRRCARMADEAGPQLRVLQPPDPADVQPRACLAGRVADRVGHAAGIREPRDRPAAASWWWKTTRSTSS